jgi:cell division protein FtsB
VRVAAEVVKENRVEEKKLRQRVANLSLRVVRLNQRVKNLQENPKEEKMRERIRTVERIQMMEKNLIKRRNKK